MTTPDQPRYQRYDAAGAGDQRDTVELVYCDAYADAITSGDPFESREASMARFDSYIKAPGFDLVIAYLADEPIGQAWGWPLGENSGWWQGLMDEPEPGFMRENGHRTFGFSELMIRRGWAGRGYAHALHDELLRGRPEQRATLLVDPTNERAQRAYTKWGWRQAGRLRPGWENAPLFNVLMIDLPLESATTLVVDAFRLEA